MWKGWPEYKAWDWSRIGPHLEAVAQARNDLNHKSVAPMDSPRVRTILGDMIAVCTALGLDTSRLLTVQSSLDTFSGTCTVHAVSRGGMRIPFKDPRKYLVGRDALLEDVAAECRGQPRCRAVLCGDSGAGKTVTVCYPDPDPNPNPNPPNPR